MSAASDCDCKAIGLDPVISICENPPSGLFTFTKVSITQHVNAPEVKEVKLGGEVCFLLLYGLAGDMAVAALRHIISICKDPPTRSDVGKFLASPGSTGSYKT